MNTMPQYKPLADEAAAAVARRQAQYPALVKAGKVSADQSDRELRVWRSIAVDWRWVVSLDRPEAPAATLAEKIDALEESVRRAERSMRKAFASAESGVRDAWGQLMPIAAIAERFGEAASPFLAEWDQYWRLADLLEWYRRDLPDSPRPGIAHFVHQAAADTGRRRAA